MGDVVNCYFTTAPTRIHPVPNHVKKKYLTLILLSCMIAKVTVMNKILEQALLYDFYGELLTPHQKEIYEQFVLEDLSLSEIAEGAGISRQGVHDLVKRCQRSLEGYEAKLHLVERFLSVKEKVGEIEQMLICWQEKKGDPDEIVRQVLRISGTIIEEL